MKVVSSEGLTELIQLSKDTFVDKTNVVQATTTQLANVATSGDYDDLTNKPTIPTTTSSVTSGSTAALTSGGAYTALQNYQTTANLVTSVSNSSTNTQYPSAKCLYNNINSHYGTCSTAAGTQAKEVTCSGFTLRTGISIRVKFTNAQTYNGQPTLNVNSTGALKITLRGTTAGVRYMWQAGDIVEFTYDGTSWVWERGAPATTSYYGVTKLTTSAASTSTATALTPATLNNYSLNMVSGAPIYSASETYAIGDRVRYSYQTWTCTTAITTAEAWNAEHWTPLDPLQTQIDDIYSQIGDVETLINAL